MILRLTTLVYLAVKGIPTERGSAGGERKDDGSGALSSSFGKSGGSPSYGKSPGAGGAFSLGSAGHSLGLGGPCPPTEVNRRGHQGGPALHLVCSSLEPVAIEYLSALLAHPAINVNLQDHESGESMLASQSIFPQVY